MVVELRIADYEKFVERHGEAAAQALIENIERYEGIRSQTLKPLCERWTSIMNASFEIERMAA